MNKLTQAALSGMAITASSLSLASPCHAEALSPNEVEGKVKSVGYGHLAARALHIAGYYKLFDPLEGGPKTASQIAEIKGLEPSAVKRLLRILANHEILNMDGKGNFALNDASKLLVSTAQGSLQPAMAKEFDLKRWNAIGNIHIALETDIIPFNGINQQSFYEYLESNQAAGELFNAGMKNFSKLEDEVVAQSFNFSDYKSYCDVGGGSGSLISQVSHHHSTPEIILFDLDGPIDQTNLENITKIKGSFFDKIPEAELFTLKRVLHNWDDENSIKILSNVRDAVSNRDKGRILVIDKVLKQIPDGSLLEDTDMLGLALGGQERTLEEFKNLGEKANLTFEKVIPTPAGVSILVFKIR